MPWQNGREDRRRSDATYGDPEYKRNRPLAMKRDRYRCQLRLAGCLGGASECDHIVGVAEAGTHPHALSNLRAVCVPCHRTRTADQGGGFRSATSTRDPAPQPRTTW